MIRDRDSTSGDQFRRCVRGLGIEDSLTAPRSAWQDPFPEHLVGSVRIDGREGYWRVPHRGDRPCGRHPPGARMTDRRGRGKCDRLEGLMFPPRGHGQFTGPHTLRGALETRSLIPVFPT